MVSLCIYESIEENDSDVHYIKMSGKEFSELMKVVNIEWYKKFQNYHLIAKSLFDEKHLSEELKKGEE